MQKIILIGNGILSLMTALRLVQSKSAFNISIVGPNDRKGCASVAAPAMLNSYAELTRDALSTPIDKDKFKISRLAGAKWKNIFDELDTYDVPKAQPAFGTYLLNNTTTDDYDDDNFNAIIEYLDDFNEEYEFVKPKEIPGYEPSSRQRAVRALYLKNEGFVNSEYVLDYLVDYLKNNKVNFIDSTITKLNMSDNKIKSVTLEDNSILEAETFLLAPGANFSKIVDNSNLGLNFQRVLYGSGVALEIKPQSTMLTNCVRTPNRGMACGIYSAPRTEDTIFVGASNLIADYGLEHGLLTSLESLLKGAMEQINTNLYNAGLVATKIGWRPTTEDTYPLLGKTKIENLIVATGTKRDGFHMSPIISEYITSLILNEEYEHAELFKHFKPEREIIRNITKERAIKEIVDHQISAMFQHDFVPPKSNMLNDYKKKLEAEAIEVHNKFGAVKWGIPPELYSVYKGGYLSCDCLG